MEGEETELTSSDLQALLKADRLACEAGVSIKPGAQAPGSNHKNKPGARDSGRQREIFKLSPAVAGSGPF